MSWYHYPLKDLLDASKSESAQEISEKLAYVQYCKQSYEECKKRLTQVAQETKGNVCETQDPEIARSTHKKILIKNVMEYSPSDIGALGFQIERTLKDYRAGRK
jgi:hypothetical protein